MVVKKVTDVLFPKTRQINKATRTTVLFRVDEPFACCSQPGVAYAIIQFVRHSWQVGNHPQLRDAWNLDGDDSQAQQNSKGLPYDPTYTDDPAHGGNSDGKSNTYVEVGPWDPAGSGPAISVTDLPGLLEPQHELFVREGGIMVWEFVTLLVCRANPASAEQYLKSGLVCAKQHYTIERKYTAGKAEPEVEPVKQRDPNAPPGPPEFYPKCRPLAVVLDKISDPEEKKKKSIEDAFSNPRPHVLKLP
jgi:hypothetical protein